MLTNVPQAQLPRQPIALGLHPLQFWAGGLLLSACLLLGAVPSRRKGDTIVVNGQLGALEKSQPISDDLDPPSVEPLNSVKTRSRMKAFVVFLALPCTLVPPRIQEESPFHPSFLPQSTLHDESSWRPHRQVREDKGQRQREASAEESAKVGPQTWSHGWWGLL